MGWELATGHYGIGFSGVNYGVIGFGIVAREFDDDLKAAFNTRVVQLQGIWLVFCIFMTQFGAMQVANVAHVVGLGTGLLVGLGVYRGNYWASSLAASLCIAALIPHYYNPNSIVWNFDRGVDAFHAKNYPLARKYWERTRDLEVPNATEVNINLALTYAHLQLSKEYGQAVEAVRVKSPKEARVLEDSYGLPLGHFYVYSPKAASR